jgi:hypothetical protein
MRTGYMAIGLAAIVSVVPASFAQHSRVLAHGKSAATGIEARQTQQTPGSNTGISLAVPIGRVEVSPESLDGEAIYVRRMTVREGITIVEVSTTPFVPEALGVGELIVRPDQPASW